MTLWWKLRWALLRGARRVLAPDAAIVFGYLAEDLIISRFLASHRYTGFYVDVGCNDAVKLSNTLVLYERGWRGVNIDANRRVLERIRRDRPRDTCICALVGMPGETRELVVFADDARSTADRDFVAAWSSQVEIAERVSMPTRSLSSILDELGPLPQIDLLNIDVEGMEIEVLESMDFERFPVGLVAAEIHGLDASVPESSAVVRCLRQQGFRLLAYNGLTAFFEKRGARRATSRL